MCTNAFVHSNLRHILQGTPFVLAETGGATPRSLQRPTPKPALVIIEANHNITLLREIVKRAQVQSPEARIVVLADRLDLNLVRWGHEVGVNGFCLAASAPEVLIASLQLVMLGESVVPSAVLRSFLDGASLDQTPLRQDSRTGTNLSGQETCRLSARETEILGYLREGVPNKAIARKLDLTEATVKVHVKAILRKIGAANRTQAALWAFQRLPNKVEGL
jgi:two-component system nitrate/nitrite response regulator NarL